MAGNVRGQAARAYTPGAPASAPARRSDVVQLSPNVQNLVAATVAKQIDFDAPAVQRASNPARAANVLRMYARSADAMEAAVAIERGRNIDVRA